LRSPWLDFEAKYRKGQNVGGTEGVWKGKGSKEENMRREGGQWMRRGLDLISCILIFVPWQLCILYHF